MSIIKKNEKSSFFLFSVQIISWYRKYKRDLPWRNTKNAYKIWLSEIILQQTRVVQGYAYYERFLEVFPTIEAFASANEQEILRLWQGLGYYSRARNMHKTAKYIVENLNGKFPEKHHELLKLKGIGPYTAAAIASLAFDEPVAVVDGNVYRLLSRFFGIGTDISSSKAYRTFFDVAMQHIPLNNPADFNQAMMELGAIQCLPKSPLCATCPLALHCFAFQHNLQANFPVKTKKTKVRKRFFYYLVLKKGEKFYLKKRQVGDIWEGLYDFYLIEKEENKTTFDDLTSDFILTHKPNFMTLSLIGEVKHILTHQHLWVQFWLIDISNHWNFEPENFYSLEEIQHLPKPIVIDNFFKKHLQ